MEQTPPPYTEKDESLSLKFTAGYMCLVVLAVGAMTLAIFLTLLSFRKFQGMVGTLVMTGMIVSWIITLALGVCLKSHYRNGRGTTPV